MNRILVGALATASCLLGANSASATIAHVRFLDNGVVLATWGQQFAPTPLTFTVGTSTNVSIFDTTGSAAGFTNVTWFHFPSGGLDIGGTNGPVNETGMQSYTGLESAPVFVAGVYQEFIGLGHDYTVTISVPEPATWAMMLVGFGMIGFAARRRRNVSVTYA